MPPQASSYHWVRSLLLVVSTLAIVGVLFALYVQYTQSPEANRTEAVTIRDPAPLSRQTTTRPAGGGALRVGDVPVDQGGKIKLNIYPREGTEARMELAVDSFKAVEGSENQMHLQKPVIRFRTPSGQLVRVESDEGLVNLTRQRGESYDLARGTLTGSVRVTMDRLTREQREQLPPAEQDKLTADRAIRAELDDLTFDLEYARVESSGRVFVSLAEADFEGHGLFMRYDEAASRVELLKVGRNGQITLRRLGGAMAIGLPAAADSAAPAVLAATSVPATQPVPEAEEAVIEAPGEEPLRVDEDGVPYFVPDAPQPRHQRQRESVTYRAVFSRGVTVDQFDGRTQVGLLTSDELAFLFDFGQKQREQARMTPATQPAEPKSADSATERTDGESVVLRWSGPLVVEMVRDALPPAEGEPQRLQITAAGDEVYVADRRGNARCRKLVHHQETNRLWLEGDESVPLVMDLGSDGQLTGREVFWDGSSNTISVSGPGILTGARGMPGARASEAEAVEGSDQTAIRFRDEMRLCLAAHAEERWDPIKAELVAEERQVLQSALLTGEVVMSQGADSIAGARVEATFGPPLRQGTFADHLQTLRVQGGVSMVQGGERITCDSMDVALAPDPTGRVAPVRAVAVGRVFAGQGSRSITAGERMIVELESQRVEKPPFDLVQAKVIAARRGHNVQEIDWARQQREYEERDEYEPGLRHLKAFDSVRVEDPAQGLSITAGTLDCAFKGGSEIEKGVVVGQAGQPASVAFGDFGIMGERVDFDAASQWAHVPGAGRMTFLGRKDLDGRALDRPQPTAITWSNRMTFRGRENQAVFSGAVHAVSETSTFDCREMIVDFVEDEAGAGEEAAVNPFMRLWVLQPWLSRTGRAESRRLEAPSIRKQPTYLTAKGDVVALTAANAANGRLKSRARLAGPHLAVDLRSETQSMTVDGAGTLLIEDYELKGPGAANATRTSPFGLEGSNLPSQTFIAWAGSMSYYGANRLAVFDREVDMAHRSGAQLILAEGVLSDTALAQIRDSGKGRDARLSSQQLNVQFRSREDENRPRLSKGLGGMSGNEVASFAASGNVYFEDSGVSVSSQTITFDRQRNLLQILGTDVAPAELIDQRGGRYRSMVGPEIYWDRASDEITAPRAKIRAR